VCQQKTLCAFCTLFAANQLSSLRDLSDQKRVVSGWTIDIMKKPNMFRILVTTVSVAAFALCSWSARGQAAPTPAPQAVEEHFKVEDGRVWTKRGTAWVNVGSDNMGGAVKALREIYPSATFAIDPRVADVLVTDLIVRADDPMTDLEALQTSCGGRFSIAHDPNPNMSGAVPGRDELYKIEYNNSTESKPSKGEDRKIECFNLTHYLDREKALNKDETNSNKGQGGGLGAMMMGRNATHAEVAVARLQDIIQQTLADFDPTAANQLHFRFYSEAQLLIVIGPERAIDVAAKVIQALPGEPTFTRNPYGAVGYGQGQRPWGEMVPAGGGNWARDYGSSALPETRMPDSPGIEPKPNNPQPK
jgi:hypothetical protein